MAEKIINLNKRRGVEQDVGINSITKPGLINDVDNKREVLKLTTKRCVNINNINRINDLGGKADKDTNRFNKTCSALSNLSFNKRLLALIFIITIMFFYLVFSMPFAVAAPALCFGAAFILGGQNKNE